MFMPALAVLVVLAIDPKLERAEAQAAAFIKAAEAGNAEVWVDLSHPKYIKMMGGRESAAKRLEQEHDKMTKAGFTFGPAGVGHATDLQRTGDGLFCLIPPTSNLVVDGRKAAVEALLLGVSTDDGKNWTFLEAANGEELARRIVPEIPAGLKIPHVDQTPVEGDRP